jgi:hypothetical protein
MGHNRYRKRSREETRAVRETVDAVREIIGYAPLYNQTESDATSWLTGVSDMWQQSLQGQTSRKGGSL